MTAVADLLSMLLKITFLGIIASQLLPYIRLPSLAYRILLPLSKRSGYRTGMTVALGHAAAGAANRGDGTESIRLRRQVVELHMTGPASNLLGASLKLAKTLFQFNQHAAAAEWLGELDRATAGDHMLKPSILLIAAYALSRLGRYQEARSALERASSLSVRWDRWLQRRRLGSPRYHWDLAMAQGYVASLSGAFPEAMRFYERAYGLSLTLSRDDRLASLNNLAATSLELGHADRAAGCVDEINQLAGTQSWRGRDQFLVLIGRLRLAEGRLPEARIDLERGLNPTSPNLLTLVHLADVAYRQGAFDDAVAFADRIQIDPRDPPTRHRLGEIFRKLAEVDEASGRLSAAEQHRQRADALSRPPPPASPPAEDPLFRRVQWALAGKWFVATGSTEAAALGLYLTGWLWLGVWILLPLRLPLPAVLAQVGLLAVFLVASRPLIAWAARPRPTSA